MCLQKINFILGKHKYLKYCILSNFWNDVTLFTSEAFSSAPVIHRYTHFIVYNQNKYFTGDKFNDLLL